VKERSEENPVYKFFFIICTHEYFSLFIFALILTNTIVLSMDEYPIRKERVQTLELVNDIMSYFFAAEMAMKLIGLGFLGYSKDKFNLFDAVIVIFSMIELALTQADQQSFASNGALSAFRAIRLLRIFKLARSWKSF